MHDLTDLYRDRQRQFATSAAHLERSYNRGSLLRLAFFLLGAGLLIFAWTEWAWWYAAILSFGLLLAFALFVGYHERIAARRRHQERLAEVNRREAEALAGDWSAFPDGKEFQDAEHPYALDLDLFGPHSLFQFLNRTSTSVGRARLAAFLSAPASPAQLADRQRAIATLSDEIDWRQNFQAIGWQTDDDPHHLDSLRQWLARPPFVAGRAAMNLALVGLPLLGLAGLILWIIVLPWYAALLFYVPAILLLRQTLDEVNRTHRETSRAEDILHTYGRLFVHLEELPPAARQPVNGASQAIGRLSYIIGQLNVRYNFFAVFLNLLGLWDLQWVRQLEKWKLRHGHEMEGWFAALAEAEALQSLATLNFNQPEWAFPEIWEKPLLEARQLGHPLILPQQRVDNDFSSTTAGHLKLVTGSNMAGKSTFLRTLGINVVLALSGSVVCAEALRLPVLAIYTSMRTQDALHESASSFYAELKRLKMIIEAVETRTASEPAVFFLLDEILKGTNSRDRHAGAKALIWQLLRSGGAGIIATHDIELGQLEAEAQGAIENWCMEVEIVDGRLQFDYCLRRGVTESFNATVLMQQMGIRV